MTKLIVDGKEIDVPSEYTLLQACEGPIAKPRFCCHIGVCCGIAE
jgi:NADH-quinone oxidoreductase subunit G